MGSTNAQDLEQVLQGEYHGPESLLTRKLHLFFHLALLMEPNGSKCSLINTQYLFIFILIFFGENTLMYKLYIVRTREKNFM